ncbi:MAG: hypothetical protein AVDCRST_MAG01-01-5312 [uncultured Rubrobacteraceae bacterium]|uniref:Uncharacterized protein n=1 Tax=uncultured Rubrobacteraceae bacterium TaxID=349277 RepID=A0A6J4R283_9ACTN|nr:MAG: hypothetical protein AVDCRST_MAG01-01-5312 [uncultured Rubrobacteraceae bacterium]
MKKGQGGRGMPEGTEVGGFKVVAATLFGGIEVARYPTLEQAEWRAKQLAAEAERSPRGYIQYLVKPVRERKKRS